MCVIENDTVNILMFTFWCVSLIILFSDEFPEDRLLNQKVGTVLSAGYILYFKPVFSNEASVCLWRVDCISLLNQLRAYSAADCRKEKNTPGT